MASIMPTDTAKCNICIETIYDIELNNGKKCTRCNDGFICNNPNCNKVDYKNCLICKKIFNIENNKTQQEQLDDIGRILSNNVQYSNYLNNRITHIETVMVRNTVNYNNYRDCLDKCCRRRVSTYSRSIINNIIKIILFISYCILFGKAIIFISPSPPPKFYSVFDSIFITFIIGFMVNSVLLIIIAVCFKKDPCLLPIYNTCTVNEYT